MNYFNGINFLHFGSTQESTGCIDKFFEGYYGIQYNHFGPMYFAKGDNDIIETNGAYCFITYPGIRFRYGSPTKSTRSHNFICFTGPKIQDYISSGLLPITDETGLIKITNPDRFLLLLQRIFKRLSKSYNPDYARATHELEGLLLQLHRQKPTETKRNLWDDLLDKLVTAIRKNPQHQWDFKLEAEKLCISYTHLRRVFKKNTGLPPNQFLIKIRLNLAAGKLQLNKDSIYLIAEEVGIEDVYHFSKLFKKQYGIPPSAYRKVFEMN
ncbi:MAG: AraC family transcriptional regulator [Verrucomicrobiota bacterium]|nr:AraC family transcriptional regulator [Verrucomicrobiota bacterium]